MAAASTAATGAGDAPRVIRLNKSRQPSSAAVKESNLGAASMETSPGVAGSLPSGSAKQAQAVAPQPTGLVQQRSATQQPALTSSLAAGVTAAAMTNLPASSFRQPAPRLQQPCPGVQTAIMQHEVVAVPQERAVMGLAAVAQQPPAAVQQPLPIPPQQLAAATPQQQAAVSVFPAQSQVFDLASPALASSQASSQQSDESQAIGQGQSGTAIPPGKKFCRIAHLSMHCTCFAGNIRYF